MGKAGKQTSLSDFIYFLILSTVLCDLMTLFLIYQNLGINLEHPSGPEPKVEFQGYRKPNSSIIIQIKFLALYFCEQGHYINILLLCHLKYGCFLADRLQKTREYT